MFKRWEKIQCDRNIAGVIGRGRWGEEQVGAPCVRFGRLRGVLGCILSVVRNWKECALTYISQSSLWLLCGSNTTGRQAWRQVARGAMMGAWIRVGSEGARNRGLRMCWSDRGSRDLLMDWVWMERKKGDLSPGRFEPISGERCYLLGRNMF